MARRGAVICAGYEATLQKPRKPSLLRLQAELERKGAPAGHKGGVCLEYLRGTCTKGDACLFSHALKDYYAHVCKRKPHACIAKRSTSESLLAALVADQPGAAFERAPRPADRCRRSYVLRCMIPTLIPGDPQRAEAVIAALVRARERCVAAFMTASPHCIVSGVCEQRCSARPR